MATTLAAAPGSTVAVKVTGLSPVTCAVTRAVPAVVPSVHMVVATPLLLVGVDAGDTAPDPAPTFQSTRRFVTGLLSLSVTTTDNAVVSATPATPVC